MLQKQLDSQPKPQQAGAAKKPTGSAPPVARSLLACIHPCSVTSNQNSVTNVYRDSSYEQKEKPT